LAIVAGFDTLRFSIQSVGLPATLFDWGIQFYCLSALVACLVCLLLVVRWPAGAPARLLALGLACAANVWTTRLQVVLDPEFLDSFRLMSPAAGFTWFGGELAAFLVFWICIAAFLRFSTLFPRPLEEEDYFRAELPLGDDILAFLDRGATEWVYTLTRRVFRGAGEIMTHPFPARNPVTVLWALGLKPKWVWGIALVGGTLPSLALIWDREAIIPLLSEVTVLPLAFVGAFMNFFLGFETAGREDRRRLLWVYYGFLVAFLAMILGTFGLIFPESGRELMVAATSGPLGDRAASSLFLAVPAPWILLSLLIATFYSGEFDPSLAIRKTSVYGTLGLLFLFLFAGFGNAAEGFLESSVGLPPFAGSVVTGGTLAVILIPVKRRMDVWVNRILPVTILTEAPTRTVTILFSDIVGFGRLARDDRDGSLTLISLFEKVASRLAREHRGRVVKTVADEALLVFDEPSGALKAASNFPREMDEEAGELGLPPLQFRIGIHLGEVTVSHDGDVFGDAVNLASKIQRSAEPGQVVLSAAVNGQVEEGRFEVEALGKRGLRKGEDPVELFLLV
jgi:class 3 adenylate cyclase